MKVEPTPDLMIEALADRIASLPLPDLAYLGRPATPAKKPEAKFSHVKDGMFTYHVRGNKFHASDKLAVEGAMSAMASGNKEKALAAAKDLDSMLRRPLTLSLKTVSRNAIERLRRQLADSAKGGDDE